MHCFEIQAGVDEVGRGCLAGPVFAAAVILDPNNTIANLKDSKLLTASMREKIASTIKEKSLAWAIASASVREIENINILQASLLASQRAINKLKIIPQKVLIDGIHTPKIAIPCVAIPQGDRKIPCISAASIIAKQSRDLYMKKLAVIYPHYGFEKNKGYPTKLHLQQLELYGICIEHRTTYKPIKKLISC